VRARYSDKSKRKLAATRLRHVSPVIVSALALALSACGGGASSLGVANAQSSPTTATSSAGSSSQASSTTEASRSTTTTAAALTGSSSPSANATSEALKYAQCMRAHGVSDYRDPLATGGPPAPTKGGMTYLGNSFDPNTPTFQAAEESCQKYAVGLATRVTAAGAAKVQVEQLKYAQCMRSHGVPDFPDPSSAGGFTIPNSVDQNGPFFQAAERACKSFLPGLSGPPGT
jgi:hypothetical protein